MISLFGNNQNAGFSLIEVMIAMVILSIGILGVANMQIRATNGTSSAAKLTRADSWLTSTTEEFARLPYDNPRLLNETDDPTTYMPAQNADGIDNDSNGQIDDADDASGKIELQYTVEKDMPIDNCKRIGVTVQNGNKTLIIQYIKADII
ncbi:MAG: prepilin-type N-terminal cleavage/methylation domain-containing protein [Desulfobacteraceae bacterium]|nr:prepilin-type N-terminal cleavage/methylation domain-containing protein [Desulfobacteraceae bacterium]